MSETSIASGGPRSTKRITDPKALRALAHPIRMSLIGLLRTEGPLTATRAAELLGESSASTSFHLRQLAKYGMAEEAPGGQGRERPWQATTMSTDVPDFADDPEFAGASGQYRVVLAERYFHWLMRWLAERPSESAEWQRADQFGAVDVIAVKLLAEDVGQGELRGEGVIAVALRLRLAHGRGSDPAAVKKVEPNYHNNRRHGHA